MVDLRQYWPNWGDTGDKPPDGKDYTSGDQPIDQHYDWLWDKIKTSFGTVEDRLNAIDSNDDGVVDESDTVTAGGNLKGDLYDSAGNLFYGDTNNEVKTVRLQADMDGDGLVEDYDETLIKDGGARAVDAAELDAASGSSGQFLSTDGTDASWGDPPDTRTDVSDNGSLVVAETGDINFATNLTVTDDTDGTVTVDAVTYGEESGSFTASSDTGGGTVNVSFASTYQTGLLAAYVTEDDVGSTDAAVSAGFQSWNTNASGEITGATVWYTNLASNNETVEWDFFGVEV